jgi:cytochrome bd-type quinol oxidase subunit 2
MGRVLTFIYGIFALSATARASVQIVTKFDQAPLAYLLSLLAGLIYIAATVGLAMGRRGRKLALVCCSIEMVGVIAVGIVSLTLPEDFPHATVWSKFGQGYGFIPLVLPFLGLTYLLRQKPPQTSSPLG